MPITKRPPKRAISPAREKRRNSKRAHDAALRMADLMNELSDALDLIDGIDSLVDVQSQLEAIGHSLEELIICFSDYFDGRIKLATLVKRLRSKESKSLAAELNGLGALGSGERLVGSLYELERDSAEHGSDYPPGVFDSLLDIEDESPETATTSSFPMHHDIALIAQRLIERIRIAGFRLSAVLARLANGE